MEPYLLQHLLGAATEAKDDAIAIVDQGRSLTFGALHRRSCQLANALVDAGVGPGDRVGVYLDKSLEAVVGIYAVLFAGAVYVPLDPDAPPARLGYIAADCAIGCLLTERGKTARVAELIGAGARFETVVVLDGTTEDVEAPPGARLLDGSVIDDQSDTPPRWQTIDRDLAYILYTSGSTGQPKGVMLSHLNALTFVRWAVDEFAVSPDDRLSSHAPFHFDLSVFDLYAAAAAGARLVLVPPAASLFPVQLRRFIDTQQVTVWYSVPSILTMLVLRGGLGEGALPSLRAVLFAGEVFASKYLRRAMNLLPHVRFANLYGPTETNVCTWHEVAAPPETDDPIPIGKAIANVEVFALADEGSPARTGEVGELHVRGSTVMSGYWGDPARTARSRICDPRGGAEDPVYRTGDLVALQEDGNYRFLGRRDAQVKSRGYRIELGEIEAALCAHPSVVECAAVAVPDEVVTNRITAYVVVQGGVGEGELARACAERIPRYMIPDSFELLEALPKTSTGKTDRQALAPDARAGADRA